MAEEFGLVYSYFGTLFRMERDIIELIVKLQDEWTMCQQSWIYLEVIFSAPDIQRQLPNEAKLFVIVDKSWKEIMRRTAKVSFYHSYQKR